MSEPFLDAKRFVVRMRDDRRFRDSIVSSLGDPSRLAVTLKEARYQFTQAELEQAIAKAKGLGDLTTILFRVKALMVK